MTSLENLPSQTVLEIKREIKQEKASCLKAIKKLPPLSLHLQKTTPRNKYFFSSPSNQFIGVQFGIYIWVLYYGCLYYGYLYMVIILWLFIHGYYMWLLYYGSVYMATIYGCYIMAIYIWLSILWLLRWGPAVAPIELEFKLVK